MLTETDESGASKETWRPVVGYEGLYEVSDWGNVKTLINKRRLLKPRLTNRGYLSVVLSDKTGVKHKFVHRLVGLSFLENARGKPTVNHKNCIKTDNNLANLEWATQREQLAHALITRGPWGVKGEASYNARLTEGRVLLIRAMYATGRFLQREIEEALALTKNTAGPIIRRTNWKHI